MFGPAPARRSQSLEVEEEAAVLDEVIEQIDQSLPILHRMAAEGESADTPTTGRLSKAQFDRARAVFQDMQEDPLLTDEGDDIRLKSKKSAVNGAIDRINGKHP
jgi:hypothetical protein